MDNIDTDNTDDHDHEQLQPRNHDCDAITNTWDDHYLLLVLVVKLKLDIGGTDNPDDRLLGLDICLLYLLRLKHCHNWILDNLKNAITFQLISQVQFCLI